MLYQDLSAQANLRDGLPGFLGARRGNIRASVFREYVRDIAARLTSYV